MRAVEISAPEDPEVLRIVERATPTPGAGKVLIKVEAAGVNRPDIMQRQGKYPPPPGASDIPGSRSRERSSVGSDTTRCARWSPAVATRRYCVVPVPQCLPIPRAWTCSMRPRSQRRSSPSGPTCSSAAVWREGETAPRPRRHQRHRHHGHPAGARVRRTRVRDSGLDEKCRACETLGASAAINYRDRGLRRRRCARPPTAAASTSCSTWSAATTRRATSMPRDARPAGADRSDRRLEGAESI